MEEIIKKAVEGGYKFPNLIINEMMFKDTWRGRFVYGKTNSEIEICLESIVCESIFWQALGKAYGWKTIHSSCGTEMKPRSPFNPKFLVCWLCYGDIESGGKEMIGWLYHALRFHEINLTEGWSEAVTYLQGVTK